MKEYEIKFKSYVSKEVDYDLELINFNEKLSKNRITTIRSIHRKYLEPKTKSARHTHTLKRGYSEIYFLQYLMKKLEGLIFMDIAL